MANQTETYTQILKFKLEGDSELKKRNSEILKSINDNQTAIAVNNLRLKELSKEYEKNAEKISQLKQENIAFTQSNRALNSELQNNIKQITNEVGALNEKKAILSNMVAAYNKLSTEQATNTAEGIAAGKAIRKLSDEIGNQEKALGNATRDVGKYTEGIIAANEQLGFSNTILGKTITGYKAFKTAALEASVGTSVLNGALKMLMANPVFAIIAIVAGVFMLLKEAIGKNAQILDEFNKVLAPFKVIIGAILGIISDLVKFIVGGLAKGMEQLVNLFGGATSAANEYIQALKAMDAAEDKLLNLRIREKAEQKEINNLMALADNRMIQGKQRREAITKAIEMQIKTAKEQAEQEKILLDGTRINLETEYKLRGKLLDDNLQLTQEANDKLSQEDKDALKAKLDAYMSADQKESELRRTSARKMGTIQKSIIADEKAQRDLQIAAMADGLGKQLATIESNYKAEKQTIAVTFTEQRKLIENNLQIQLQLYKDNYALRAQLSLQFYKDIQEVNKQEEEQQKQIDAAQAREKANASRNAAKSAADSRIGLERQIQDSYLATLEEGYAKEAQVALIAFQRKKEDLKREMEFSGKNKKEVKALLLQLDAEYYETARKKEEAHQLEIEELISGKLIQRKAKEIELRLDVVREGTKAELDLKIQQLQMQRDVELKEAAALGADILLVKENFAKQEADLKEKYEKDAQEKVLAAQVQGWKNQLAEAQLAGESKLTQLQLEQEVLQRERDNTRIKEGESNEAYTARVLELQQQITDNLKAQTDERSRIREVELQVASVIVDGISALSDILAIDGEKNAAFAKALALFNIAINSALAVSNAVASAKGLTGIDYILQVATGITAALSGIAQARKLLSSAGDAPKAAKKATGGLIDGPGSGTSDSVPIWASANESILNAQSTGMFAPLLSGLNLAGGGVPIQSVNKSQEVMGEQFLANAFMKALVAMPAPVLDIQEFHRADDRLTTIQENAVR